MRHSWKPDWKSEVNTLDVDATGFTLSGDKEIQRVDFGTIRSGYWFHTAAYGAGTAYLKLDGENGETVQLANFQGWLGGDPVKFHAALGDVLRALGAQQPQLEITIGGSSRERLQTLLRAAPLVVVIIIFNALQPKADFGMTAAIGVIATAALVFAVYRMYGGLRPKTMTARQLADVLSCSD